MRHVGYVLYAVTVVVAAALALLARIYFDSTRGLLTLAVRENELRVEYLGGSVRRAMAINFVLAAFAGGTGGALTVMSLGHIEPELQLLDDLGRVRLRRDPGRLAERARGLPGVDGARGGALVLEPLLPEHLAALARPVPAVRDPLPAARHRLAVDRPHRRRRAPPRGRDERAAAARVRPREALRRAGRGERDHDRRAARRAGQPDRQQRRRQDDLRQHDHRLPEAGRRPDRARPGATSRRSARARSRGSASRARSRSRSSTRR